MKRGTPEHPKTLRLGRKLARAIGVDVAIGRHLAVSVLERLWHWVARSAPDGDLSPLDPDDLADVLAWPGDGNELVSALVDAGFLDRLGEQLLVHGWSEHCDDAVHLFLARARRRFSDGTIPRLTRLSKEDREALQAFYTAQEKEKRTDSARNAHRKRTKERTASASASASASALPLEEEEKRRPDVSPPKPADAAPAGTAKRGTTDPPERLTDEQRRSLDRWCAEKHPSKLPRVRDLEEACLDYFRSRGKRHRDWLATVRTWVRNERASPAAGVSGVAQRAQERAELLANNAREAIRNAEERERQRKAERQSREDRRSDPDVRRLRADADYEPPGDVRRNDPPVLALAARGGDS